MAHLHKLMEEIDDLAARGRRIAFGLMTINNVTPEQNTTLNSIVSKLFALIGVSNLLKDLLIVGSRPKDPVLPLLRWQALQDIGNVLQEWNLALTSLGPIITDSDSHIGFRIGISASSAPITCSFPEVGMADALVKISNCLYGFSTFVGDARSEELQRLLNSNYIEGDATLERILKNEQSRLLEANKRLSDRNASSSFTNSTPLFENYRPGGFGSHRGISPPVSFIPSQNHTAIDIKELQHPKGLRGRYGEPDYPLMEKKPHIQLNPPEDGVSFDKSFEEFELERWELRRQGRYPNPAMFGLWPPDLDMTTVQGRQIQEMVEKINDKVPATDAAEKNPRQATENTSTAPRSKREASSDAQPEFEILSNTDGGVNTPGTTRDNTPVPRSKPGKEEEEGGFSEDQKTPTPSIAVGCLEENPHIQEEVANTIEDATPKEVLEAYMLTPRAEQIDNMVEWSAKILKLPLELEQVETYVNSLDEKYSVVESINNLNPEEWRTIRAYTTPRGATVVSIQKSHNVTMPTLFGTFDVPCHMFVIKVAQGRSNLLFGDNVPTAFKPTSGLGGFGQGTRTGGLFGRKIDEEQWGPTRQPGWGTNNGQSAFGTGYSGGLFGGAKPFRTNTQPAPREGFSFSSTERAGGVFGAPQTTGSLFGTTRPSRFGNPPQQPSPFNTNGPSAGIFGSSAGIQHTRNPFEAPQTQTSGLFGGAPPQPIQTTGLFGTPQPRPSGLFGGVSQQPPQTTSLFGTGSTSLAGSGSLFPPLTDRTASQTQSASGSLFGGNNSTQGCWARSEPPENTTAPTRGLLAGLTNQPATSTIITSSLFGNTAAPAASSNSNAGGLFANFGKKPATSSTSGSSLFGKPQVPSTSSNTPSGGLFSGLAGNSTEEKKITPTTEIAAVKVSSERPSSTPAVPTAASPAPAIPQLSAPPTAVPTSENAQSRTLSFASPSPLGAPKPSTSNPIGTPPSSSGFAQYAGGASAFGQTGASLDKPPSIFGSAPRSSTPAQTPSSSSPVEDLSGGDFSIEVLEQFKRAAAALEETMNASYEGEKKKGKREGQGGKSAAASPDGNASGINTGTAKSGESGLHALIESLKAFQENIGKGAERGKGECETQAEKSE